MSAHLLIIILYAAQTVQTYEKTIGDKCIIEIDEHPGVCKLASDCPTAFQQMYDDRADVCSFIDDIRIVICCEIQTPTTEKQIAVPEIKHISDSQSSNGCLDSDLDRTKVLEPGYISSYKCCEYRKYAYINISYAVGAGERVASSFQTCRHYQPVIVGGNITLDYEFPHMALLGYDTNNGTQWLCGGSLISERFVLTAAHCLNVQWAQIKWVKLGARDLSAPEENRKDYAVEKYYVNPSFHFPKRYQDIALLKLKETVDLSHWVRPACLHTSVAPMSDVFVATGWGLSDPGESRGTSQLMKVELDLFTATECERAYGNDRVKFPRGFQEGQQICAGSRNYSRDTCRGDSGGPLQVYDKSIDCMFRVFGVTSVGKHCALINQPAIYTRVSYYVGWIENIVWPELKQIYSKD